MADKPRETHPMVYKEKFPVGAWIRIKDQAYLQKFKAEWKFHHPISADQVAMAGRTDIVRKVGFYHGGDVLYELEQSAGTWHESCLEAI
jgi:hypothetical protein